MTIIVPYFFVEPHYRQLPVSDRAPQDNIFSTMASPRDSFDGTNSHGKETVDTATPVIVESKGTDTSPTTDMAPSAVDDSHVRGVRGEASTSPDPVEELGKVTRGTGNLLDKQRGAIVVTCS